MSGPDDAPLLPSGGPSRRTFLRAAATLGGAACLAVGVGGAEDTPAAMQRRPMAAIFDEDFGWIGEVSAKQALERVRKAGFNVFVPCIWQGAGTSWPSRYAPSLPAAAAFPEGGPDAVAGLIDQAAASGIDVLLWFYVVHGGWGDPVRPDLRGEDTPAHFYDVHDPRFRSWIVELIEEAVQRYPQAAGVCLDYLRSGSSGWREPAWQDRYAAETGRSLLVDIMTPSGRASISDWHARACTAILTAITRSVRAVGGGKIIAVCAAADEADDRLQGRTAREWVNAGLADVLFWMDYRASPDFAQARQVSESLRDPRALVLACGNFVPGDNAATTAGDTRSVVRTLAANQQQLSADVAVYSYRTLTDEQVAALPAVLALDPDPRRAPIAR